MNMHTIVQLMNFFRYINEDYNKFRLNFTKHNRNNVV